MQGVRPGFPGDTELRTDTAQNKRRFDSFNKLCGGRYTSVVSLIHTRFAELTIQHQGFESLLKVGQNDWDFFWV